MGGDINDRRYKELKSLIALALGGISGTPTQNLYWQQATWYVDPQNITGLASDSNTGLDALHPLLTYGHILALWGTFSPRLQQNTTITFLSSHTNGNDPVYLAPRCANRCVCTLVGNIGPNQLIATGVLSNVTARNQAAGTFLLAQSGATAVNQMVVNTQAGKSSRAFTYAVSAGSIFKMSQPCAPVVLPANLPTAEVTWANGDSVNVYQPVAVNIVLLACTLESLDASFDIPLQVNSLSFFAPFALDPVSVQSGLVSITECFIPKTIQTTVVADVLGSVFHNCAITGILHGVGGYGSPITVTAGYTTSTTSLSNVSIGVGLIIGGFFSVGGLSSSQVDLAIDTGKTLSIQSGTLLATGGAGTVFWGGGTIAVGARAHLRYHAPALAAFLQLGGLTLPTFGSSAYSIVGATPAVWNQVTLNPTNLDAAAGAAGFGGIAIDPGGASSIAII